MLVRKSVLGLSFSTMTLFFVLILTCICWAGQIEPEIDCPDTTAENPVTLAYGFHTSGCQISPENDFDHYQFNASLGNSVRLFVSGTSPYLDLHVEVTDPAGVVATGECGAGPLQCTVKMDMFDLDPGGTYRVMVRDWRDYADTGNYVINLERIPPARPQVIYYGEALTDSLNPISDVDWFQFEAIEGTEIQIRQIGKSDQFDHRMEVWDPSGARIVDKYCHCGPLACTITETRTISLSGNYIVASTNKQNHLLGNYQLQLLCLSGDDCPECFPSTENCGNGLDDDCDGWIDGADTDDCPSTDWSPSSAQSSTYGSEIWNKSEHMNVLIFLLIPIGIFVAVRILSRQKWGR